MLRAAAQHHAAVIQKGAQNLLERAHLRRAPVDQHVHVQAEPRFQIGLLEQHPHQQIRVDILGAWLQQDADIFRALVPDIGEDRQLFRLDQLRDFFDQAGLGHLVGDLGDDDLPLPAAQILPLPAGAQTEGAAPGAVGLCDVFRRLHQHTTPGEIRAGDVVQKCFVPRVWRLDQVQAGLDQLIKVVGWDVRGHPHGNAAGPIGQQVGKARGQYLRLRQGAVVIVPEIDRVLIQPVQQGLGGGGQAGFRVARRRGVVPVHIAEIALTVDQRVADVEILRQTGHRVIDRGVAMGVVIAHHVAADLGGFAETPGGRQPQFPHRVEDPPVDRFQPVAGIGQRAVHDRAERILQVALANRAAQRFRQRGGIYRAGGVGQIVHRAVIGQGWGRVKTPPSPGDGNGLFGGDFRCGPVLPPPRAEMGTGMLLRLTVALLAILAALYFAAPDAPVPSRADLAALREERQRAIQLSLPNGPTPAAPEVASAPVDPPQTPAPLPESPVEPEQPAEPAQLADAAPAPEPAQPDAPEPPAPETAPDPEPEPEPVAEPAAPAPEPAAEPEPQLLYVTGSRVNLRAGPSTENAVRGQVVRGQAVELVTRLDTGWVEIRAEGVDGTVYMSGDFLSETP